MPEGTLLFHQVKRKAKLHKLLPCNVYIIILAHQTCNFKQIGGKISFQIQPTISRAFQYQRFKPSKQLRLVSAHRDHDVRPGWSQSGDSCQSLIIWLHALGLEEIKNFIRLSVQQFPIQSSFQEWPDRQTQTER